MLLALARRYVAVTSSWSAWEMRQRFWVEFPCALAYIGCRLVKYPCSALCMVFYRQWTVRIAVFVRWEAHDYLRLCY